MAFMRYINDIRLLNYILYTNYAVFYAFHYKTYKAVNYNLRIYEDGHVCSFQ